VRLNGKVAVVTGGGNGIGAAIGARMAEEGAAVAVVDVDAAAGEQTAAASFHLCDVTDEDAVAATFADVVARHGRLDVLVNNAGVAGLNAPTHEFPRGE
jgi:NAD(P)-dependent dehydrogenase (short-subunit alcohol dehydrogenase family)